jgi:hypothetical protein
VPHHLFRFFHYLCLISCSYLHSQSLHIELHFLCNFSLLRCPFYPPLQGLHLECTRSEIIPGLLIESCENPSRTPQILRMDSGNHPMISQMYLIIAKKYNCYHTGSNPEPPQQAQHRITTQPSSHTSLGTIRNEVPRSFGPPNRSRDTFVF